MQKLKDIVDAITSHIDPGKEVPKEITKELEQIEYKLFNLIEQREYIEQCDLNTFKEVEALEKKLE